MPVQYTSLVPGTLRGGIYTAGVGVGVGLQVAIPFRRQDRACASVFPSQQRPNMAHPVDHGLLV